MEIDSYQQRHLINDDLRNLANEITKSEPQLAMTTLPIITKKTTNTKEPDIHIIQVQMIFPILDKNLIVPIIDSKIIKDILIIVIQDYQLALKRAYNI